MKKKIIFMIINMNVGGTEKALLNMIAEIPEEKYEITILMLEEYGGFLSHIPQHVIIKIVKNYDEIKNLVNNPPLQTSLNLLKKGNILSGIKLIFTHLYAKVKNDRSIYFKKVLSKYEMENIEYDLAVAYAGPMDFISYFVLNKIKAKKKAQWIHFDISKLSIRNSFEIRMYNFFDCVFVVSQEIKTNLINIMPHLSSKTEVFKNIIPTKSITTLANVGKGYLDEFDGIRILTVGRLTIEKGQDLAIEALSKLIKSGYNVKWYCLGEGVSRSYYEKMVEENNLKGKFILLGNNPNPYPYIKECDIYVQPSRHEGFCLTLGEARFFKKPIVSTNTLGAKGQLKNNETGLLVPVDPSKIYEAIIKLVNDKELLNKLSGNLEKEIFKSNEIEKIYKLTN
ncbi:glycosyltransferase [Metabacillus sp. cB07]|uniref:glycosyltransferase n=1 Tax=Metabacillus sp. cB07 TaxID=2806989 RepID=UPI00193A24C6|nr:glycosyltransferase [Metabacillus sp. cB07]